MLQVLSVLQGRPAGMLLSDCRCACKPLDETAGSALLMQCLYTTDGDYKACGDHFEDYFECLHHKKEVSQLLTTACCQRAHMLLPEGVHYIMEQFIAVNVTYIVQG